VISLAGKAALITGGSRGIGAAGETIRTSRRGRGVQLQQGKEAAALVESEARKHGTRVEAFKADVSKHADNKKLVDQTIERLGRIDILVANAGVWNSDDQPIEK
jgi:NAD(P)-dependent dehydrogenase (short-subunit alcohol dehydrogenase family)